MKSFSILAAATFVASAFAAGPAAGAATYTFQLKSKSPSINNLYLSSRNGKITSVRGNAGAATKFFTSTYAPTGTLSFHSGDDTMQLALQLQSTGLLQLVDLRSPTTDSTRGKPTEWSVFAIGPDYALQVQDGAVIPSRQWISYVETDGQNYIGLWDGFTRLPKTFSNVTISVTSTY